MHVDAVLVVGARILEIVGEAEDARQFIAGVRFEVGVATADIDRPVPDAEIGQPRVIIRPGRHVGRGICHEIVHAGIPTQTALRPKIAEAIAGVEDALGPGHAERTDARRDDRIDVSAHVPKALQHRQVRLPSKDGRGKRVSRREQEEVGARRELCRHADVHNRIESSDRDLARPRDGAACIQGRMIKDAGSRPSGRRGVAERLPKKPGTQMPTPPSSARAACGVSRLTVTPMAVATRTKRKTLEFSFRRMSPSHFLADTQAGPQNSGPLSGQTWNAALASRAMGEFTEGVSISPHARSGRANSGKILSAFRDISRWL
jgi:hypothetical protein